MPIEPPSDTKRCPACKTVKLRSEFYRNASYCKRCSKEHNAAWCRKHGKARDQRRNRRPGTKRRVSIQRAVRRRVDPMFRSAEVRSSRRRLLTKYGISPEDYDRMLAEQNGVCAICRRPSTRKVLDRKSALVIDHDHKTKKVRALLCNNCNTAIGLFKEDPEILTSAVEYLRRHASKSSDL